MTFLFPVFVLIFFPIKIARDTLYYSYYWQLKEYRLDRFSDYIKTLKGRKQILTISILINFILILLYLLFNIYKNFDYYYFLTIAFLGFEAVKTVFDFFKRKLKRPKFTLKALLICAFVFAIEGYLLTFGNFLFENYPSPLTFLILCILVPFFVTFAVLLLKPLTYFLKQRIINKAKQKIASMPNLKVIGITGSYGKTSTKEFLYTIVSGKFKTAKTGEHINVDIGVAKEVLNNLKNDDEIFIVEMGAYKIGEIKAICDIVRPQIGIITGINEQHLSLFGSQENIIKAKSELIEALPEDGTAILNFDNEYLKELKPKAKTFFLSIETEKDCFASEIEVLPDYLKFNTNIGAETEEIKVKLLGRQNISNLLAAISTANLIGMSLKEIVKACEKIKPPEKTLEPFKGIDKSILLDDSYNANPDGVITALEYMKVYKDYKKILVFPGMLELGEKSGELHEKVSRVAAQICDYVFVTSMDFIAPIKKGLGEKFTSDKLIVESDQDKIFEKLKNLLNKDKSVVLFESRGAEKVINLLKK
jgi:UDP-N-acetylmuramoyl-tripeptide--D-alanyl-D-alanine ligase